MGAIQQDIVIRKQLGKDPWNQVTQGTNTKCSFHPTIPRNVILTLNYPITLPISDELQPGLLGKPSDDPRPSRHVPGG